MKDKYNEFACEFKNEAFCEEELEDEGTDLDEVDKSHFDDERDK